MSARFTPYVPRVLLRQLAQSPAARSQVVEGTLVFADVSGFTKLSERLARKGREGAEHLSDTISTCFSALLSVAYDNGGSLLKFGGDALLLLFEGDHHAERAVRSAAGMRRLLRTVGRIDRDGAKVSLRMSVGVHSGTFHLFLVGDSHREHIITGPGSTQVVRMENAADAGEIVLSRATARLLPARSVGPRKGPGLLLRRDPGGTALSAPEPVWDPPDELVAACLSTAVREHVLGGVTAPEHRLAAVAFIHFAGTDEIITREGPEAAVDALEELVTDVQRAADEQQVTFLASDVDVDGGKLLLAAGAPRIVGDDDERMLFALRQVVEGRRRLAIHAGVARGTVFAAEVGPEYRRTYTVMGDTTNLSARLMSKAPAGEIYATAAVLAAAASRFDAVALEPFLVKGKTRPVQAWSVGSLVAAPRSATEADRLRVIGRQDELAAIGAALDSARSGAGRVVQLEGEPGIGKSRLLDEARGMAAGMRVLRATCEAYSSSTPYSAWREILRQLLDVGWEDPDSRVLARLRQVLRKTDPGLLPWLPLVAMPAGAEAGSTSDVEAIAPEFRGAALQEVMVRFLQGQLDGPTLIEVEQAHLMDEASADLLQGVVRKLPELPWAVVVTRRATGGGFSAQAGEEAIALALDPLPLHDSLELARTTTEHFPLPPHVLTAAAERSGGNPQFLRDLLRAAGTAGADALPETVEAAAMARIDSLAPADRELVRRASVLGLTFHPRHLGAVLEDVARPDDSTWKRLSTVFEDDGAGYVRFARGVMHEAAYAGLPFGLRRRLHAAAGERLERELGEDASEQAGPLSLHFLLAGDDERAWTFACAAGNGACQRFAWADAVRHFTRALEAGRRLGLGDDRLAEVLESLGEAQARTGELSAATSTYTAARRLLAKDRLREAQLLYLHTLVAERSGRISAAVRWARRGLRALDGLEGRPAVACRARLLTALATARQRQSRHNEAIELCRNAILAAEDSAEQAALAHACYILDWALFDSGRAEEAVYSQRALEIYIRLGDQDRQAAVLNNLGAFAYHEGRWGEAVDLYQRAGEASARAGDVVNAAFGDCNVAEVRSDQGRLDEAEEALRRALLVWRGTEHDTGVAFATAQLGRVMVRAGRPEEGLALLDDALALSRELHADAYSSIIEPLRAEALVFAARAAEGLSLADSLLERPGAVRNDPLLHRVRGFALLQNGDRAGARAAFTASLDAARSLEMEYELACTLDAIGDEGSRERDAILRRLEVVALAEPSLRAAAPG